MGYCEFDATGAAEGVLGVLMSKVLLADGVSRGFEDAAVVGDYWRELRSFPGFLIVFRLIRRGGGDFLKQVRQTLLNGLALLDVCTQTQTLFAGAAVDSRRF